MVGGMADKRVVSKAGLKAGTKVASLAAWMVDEMVGPLV